jgi:signal transduction histidine kinase
VLPVIIGAIQVIGTTASARSQPDARALDWLGYTLLVAGPIALLARRRFPLAAFTVALGALVAYASVGYPDGPVFLSALAALFFAARVRWRAVPWALSAAGYAVYVLFAQPTLPRAVSTAAWVLVALTLAEVGRTRRERFREMAQAQAERERARTEQSRRQTSEERLDIARELHDVLGHHLSLINVRAGVALHLLDNRPEEARAALTAIKAASAEALGEVRSVLGALRRQDEAAPRTPAPGLADLDDLIAEAASGGLEVRLRTDGTARPVPGEVDRAGYRIVQEALTNVRRHAGAQASATVTLAYRADALGIRVDDSGTGTADANDSVIDGDGIAGMRARTAALGGTLDAGSRPGGGFRIDALLPTNPMEDPT